MSFGTVSFWDQDWQRTNHLLNSTQVGLRIKVWELPNNPIINDAYNSNAQFHMVLLMISDYANVFLLCCPTSNEIQKCEGESKYSKDSKISRTISSFAFSRSSPAPPASAPAPPVLFAATTPASTPVIPPAPRPPAPAP